LTVYLKTHILKMGRGDCIVLELPREDGALHLGIIDCNLFDVLDNYLTVNQLDNPDRVDFIAVTHPHWDHIGGIQPLLEKFGDIVDNYWESGFLPTSRTVALEHESITKLVEKKPNIVLDLPRTGDTFQFGSLDVRILTPPDPLLEGSASDINNSSIMMHMTFGRATLLFAGDAQFGNWAYCYANQRDYLNARILKISHHGSKHGNFLEALEYIDPKIAVITGVNTIDDRTGKYPHKLTQDALDELHVKHVLCTHEHGYVTIKSNSNSWHWIYEGHDPCIRRRLKYRA
jgi:competence protein ComEC